MIKVRILFSVLILAILTMALPVGAIEINPTLININKVGIIRNVLATGDALIYARTNITFGYVPSFTPSNSFNILLEYTDNSTPLGITWPINTFASGVTSMYLTPLQFSTYMAWGGSYNIVLLGNPSLFNPTLIGENKAIYTLLPGDWYEQIMCFAFISTEAQVLEVNLASDLWNSATNRLTEGGVTYFSGVIPNFSRILPEMLPTYTISYNPARTAVSENYTSDNLTSRTGTELKGAVTSLGLILGINYQWSSVLMAGIAFLLVVGIVFATVKNAAASIVVGLVTMLAFVWIGLGDIIATIVLSVTMIVIILFAVIFWRSKL